MAASSGAPAELTVLCGGALREILHDLSETYCRLHGTKVVTEFATSAAIRDRAAHGEAFDIVITTQPAIEHLSAGKKVIAGSAVLLARSAIGVAVRAGRRKPDISSSAVFVAALRSARSIARADPALGTPSGLYLAALFERLGLTAELQPKTRLVGAIGGAPVVVCEAVAKGEVELGLQQISEIVAVPGVDLVGPLPPEIQHMTVFAAAVTALARNPQLARDFVVFLASEAAKPVIAAHGMEPI
jgi:molybdate transport system substrate-binding protein